MPKVYPRGSEIFKILQKAEEFGFSRQEMDQLNKYIEDYENQKLQSPNYAIGPIAARNYVYDPSFRLKDNEKAGIPISENLRHQVQEHQQQQAERKRESEERASRDLFERENRIRQREQASAESKARAKIESRERHERASRNLEGIEMPLSHQAKVNLQQNLERIIEKNAREKSKELEHRLESTLGKNNPEIFRESSHLYNSLMKIGVEQIRGAMAEAEIKGLGDTDREASRFAEDYLYRNSPEVIAARNAQTIQNNEEIKEAYEADFQHQKALAQRQAAQAQALPLERLQGQAQPEVRAQPVHQIAPPAPILPQPQHQAVQAQPIPIPDRPPENAIARAQEAALAQAQVFAEPQVIPQVVHSPSPSNAAAISDAMQRANAAASVQVPPPSAQAHDPSQASSQRNIDPERARATSEIMARARHLSLQPPFESIPAEQRLAFPTPEELQPLRMARQHGIQHPHYSRAQERAEVSHQRLPYRVQEYMNPYHQNVINRIAEEGNRNLFENIMPALEARYIRLGQHGGKRYHDLGARAIRDVQKEISAQQSLALANAYENAANQFNVDQARQLEAAKMHSMLGQQSQASRLADIAALQEAEHESRAFRQNVKDFEHHELQRIRQHPQEMLNMYSQLMQGQPYSTSTHTYTPSPPQSWHRGDYQRAMAAAMPSFITRMGSHFLP